MYPVPSIISRENGSTPSQQHLCRQFHCNDQSQGASFTSHWKTSMFLTGVGTAQIFPVTGEAFRCHLTSPSTSGGLSRHHRTAVVPGICSQKVPDNPSALPQRQTWPVFSSPIQEARQGSTTERPSCIRFATRPSCLHHFKTCVRSPPCGCS